MNVIGSRTYSYLITDQYGGAKIICGNPYHDSVTSGSYKAVKAKDILKGDWTSDTGSGSQKLGSVGLTTDGKLVIEIGSYCRIGVINLTNFFWNVSLLQTKPTIARYITEQS